MTSPAHFADIPGETVGINAPAGLTLLPRATGSLAPVCLPRDEAPHRAAIEWWHFMAHLTCAGRVPRRSTLVVSLLKGTPLGLESMTGLAGLAIRIDHGTRAYEVEHVLRPFASAHRPSSDAGGNRFHLSASPGLGPRRAISVSGGMGRYEIALAGKRPLRLALRQDTPAALFGDRGVTRYPGGSELGHYAFTNLEVTGEDDHVPVRGQAWMEHQWGDARVRDHRWKYLAIHLDGGEQVVAFRVESRRGTAPALVYVALVDTSGVVHRLADAALVDLDGHGGARSRLSSESARLDLEVEPLFAGQTCTTPLSPWLLPAFFEGASRVQGTMGGRAASGLAITELCGTKGGLR